MLDCHRDSQAFHQASIRLSLLELAQPVCDICDTLCYCFPVHIGPSMPSDTACLCPIDTSATLNTSRQLAKYDTKLPISKL